MANIIVRNNMPKKTGRPVDMMIPGEQYSNLSKQVGRTGKNKLNVGVSNEGKIVQQKKKILREMIRKENKWHSEPLKTKFKPGAVVEPNWNQIPPGIRS